MISFDRVIFSVLSVLLAALPYQLLHVNIIWVILDDPPAFALISVHCMCAHLIGLDWIVCHVGSLHLSHGLYHVTQSCWAKLEATIGLARRKAVDWHYFCATCTEFRGRTFSGVTPKINDIFSV